jgi:hypothetical protein
VIHRGQQNPLAQMILEGAVKEGETVRVSAGAEGLLINGPLAEAARGPQATRTEPGLAAGETGWQPIYI